MIGAIVHQLTRDLTEEQIRTAGFDTYFVDRTAGVYPTAASGFPYSAASMAVKMCIRDSHRGRGERLGHRRALSPGKGRPLRGADLHS